VLLPINITATSNKSCCVTVLFLAGAWHFGQVITFAGGNSGCEGGSLVFSGNKTTVLTLPEGFLWEKTGQNYVHLWANEPTVGAVLDY